MKLSAFPLICFLRILPAPYTFEVKWFIDSVLNHVRYHVRRCKTHRLPTRVLHGLTCRYRHKMLLSYCCSVVYLVVYHWKGKELISVNLRVFGIVFVQKRPFFSVSRCGRHRFIGRKFFFAVSNGSSHTAGDK